MRSAANSLAPRPITPASASLGAPEDQAEQHDAQVALSLAQCVDPGGLERPPAIGNLDLGQSDRVQIRSCRGQDVTQPVGVLVDLSLIHI